MKRLFNTFLTLAALAAIAYPFRDRIEVVLHNVFYVPCARPITYTLGSFDAKFNVSKEYALKAIDDAVKIWEKPTGKDLFAYDPDGGDMKVNFVFDYRALVTNKLAVIDTTLKGDQASYDALKARYTGLKNQYAQLKSDYDARLAAFNEKSDAYNKKVNYWNGRGGANRDSYDDLESERKALQSEASRLQESQAEINGKVNELNGLVADLNRMAASLNLNVDEYNTVGSSRGETFEEGLYQSDGINQEIDIYEWGSRNKLVRVLAHELGHALGLGHVPDPEAIMYELNQGTDEALTSDDIAALNVQCGVK